MVFVYNNPCDNFAAENRSFTLVASPLARAKMKHFYSVCYEDDRYPAVGVSVAIVLCIMQLQ